MKDKNIQMGKLAFVRFKIIKKLLNFFGILLKVLISIIVDCSSVPFHKQESPYFEGKVSRGVPRDYMGGDPWSFHKQESPYSEGKVSRGVPKNNMGGGVSEGQTGHLGRRDARRSNYYLYFFCTPFFTPFFLL